MKKLLTIVAFGLLASQIVFGYTEIRSDGSIRPVISETTSVLYGHADSWISYDIEPIEAGVIFNNNLAIIISNSLFYEVTSDGDTDIGLSKSLVFGGGTYNGINQTTVYDSLSTSSRMEFNWACGWNDTTAISEMIYTTQSGDFLSNCTYHPNPSGALLAGTLDYTKYVGLKGNQLTGAEFKTKLQSAATIKLTDDSGTDRDYNTVQKIASSDNDWYTGITELESKLSTTDNLGFTYLGSYTKYDDYTNPNIPAEIYTMYVYGQEASESAYNTASNTLNYAPNTSTTVTYEDGTTTTTITSSGNVSITLDF